MSSFFILNSKLFNQITQTSQAKIFNQITEIFILDVNVAVEPCVQ